MRDLIPEAAIERTQSIEFQNRKRYGGMRDYNWLLEYVDWWQLAQFQNRKRYGGMRDLIPEAAIERTQSIEFQNRKRYGGMRDSEMNTGMLLSLV